MNPTDSTRLDAPNRALLDFEAQWPTIGKEAQRTIALMLTRGSYSDELVKALLKYIFIAGATSGASHGLDEVAFRLRNSERAI
jgi:hypothetical protein